MDEGVEDLVGYRSLLNGTKPALLGFDTADGELDGIVEQVTKWTGGGTSPEAIAVCLPTRDLVQRTIDGLAAASVDALEITPDSDRNVEGVRVGTMHRFKGMEFQRMIIAGVADGLIPRAGINRWKRADPARYRQELRRDRSLLFVAATRARDDLSIYWHGKPSSFLSLPG
jgi:superfamily I DNA/RNA helicase